MSEFTPEQEIWIRNLIKQEAHAAANAAVRNARLDSEYRKQNEERERAEAFWGNPFANTNFGTFSGWRKP